MYCFEWCRKMEREAKDGETAYHYNQLAALWWQREGGPCND